MDNVFIIAEMCNNHGGDFKTAKLMVERAAEAGVDAVKFQTFVPDEFVHISVRPPVHARGIHKTQIERLKSVALSPDEYYKLKKYADSLGLVFISTPLDSSSVDFLEPLVSVYKVASGDITNLFLLRKIASKKKPVILSAGMADEGEIERALKELEGLDVVVMHCISKYPASFEDLNLLSIPYLKERFSVAVGYSDHTIGIRAVEWAVALGARVVEKHFTLDKAQEIGDHKFSMDFDDCRELVQNIRRIESALGTYGIKEESSNKYIMRRSLYAKRDIEKGEFLTDENIIPLRPLNDDGFPADKVDDLIGKRAKTDIPKSGLITAEKIG